MGFVVKKNFLDNDFFLKFKNVLFSKYMPWYYRSSMTNSDRFYFHHIFYANYLMNSTLYEEFIVPILYKLDANGINEVRANLLIKDKEQYRSEFHTDRTYKCKTAILYMNTCNGFTEIDKLKKIKVECEQNKILLFDSNLEHSAVSQTDEEKRIVINFNYF